MKKTINKKWFKDDKSFFHLVFGKNTKGNLFFFPCFGFSPKRTLGWEVEVKTYFAGFWNYLIQLNVCKIVADSSKELSREHFDSLRSILRKEALQIKNVQESLAFIKNNMYIVSLLRNGNLDHPYVQKIIVSLFVGMPFIGPLGLSDLEEDLKRE